MRHRVPALLVLACLVGFLACDEGPLPRPKDPGPVIDDVPVVVFPDAGPTDPGPRPDPGTEPDTQDDVVPPDAATPDTVTPPDAPTDSGGTDPGAIDPGCIRQCVGRECGPDGCAGFCGSCTSPSVCNFSEGKCICVPECGSRVCGDNGCGGSCGSCPDGLACDEGSGKCGTSGPCPSVSASDQKYTCDLNPVVFSSRNGQSPNGSSVVFYGGSCQRYATGAEKVYRFIAPQSGPVTITMNGSGGASPLPAELDVYLLEGATCSGANCLMWSHDGFTFDAVQGTTYWLVVDATATVDLQYYMKLEMSWCAELVQ